MPYQLCATYDMEQNTTDAGPAYTCPRIHGLVARFDRGLDWITEQLDRKFVCAMERCANEDLERNREMTLLKRTVLVLVCLGLGITAVSIKLAVESQIVYLVFS